jgi:hypothetical protein
MGVRRSGPTTGSGVIVVTGILRARLAAITAGIAAFALVLPGVARAEAPTNDDFDTATVISALPFTVQQDTSAGTTAQDDPGNCQGPAFGGTVWFSFTPTVNTILRATPSGSDYDTILEAYTGVRGDLHPVPGACGVGTSTDLAFLAVAGTTYHFMISGFFVTGGNLTFTLNATAPAPNDNFADAEPLTTLPSDRAPDLSTASAEPNEPANRCTFNQVPGRSVWYTFTTATAISVAASDENFQAAVSVYTGASLADLRLVQCTQGGFGSAVFRAEPGITYHISVSAQLFVTETAQLHLFAAPALQPVFNVQPSDPNIFDNTQFSAFANDPVGQPIAGGQWDFGDGTTAQVTGSPASHRYAADGTYQVGLTVTTGDGRTGTSSRPLTVATHDVGISKFVTPAKARTGDTKPITVQVANTRYRESVTTDLFKSSSGGWSLVGTLTIDVPARADRTVKFPFAYTFTADDALIGQVTFRAVVRLPFAERDARPGDNEVIAIATTVQPGLQALRFASV